MENIINEIKKINYLELDSCHLIICNISTELLSDIKEEKNKEKLNIILELLYALKDKINHELIIDLLFEKSNEEMPNKISFYQYYLISFYTFMNIYFNQNQFIIIRFPQIFQNNNQKINYEYKLELNLLTNKININNNKNQEFTLYPSKNDLLEIYSQITSQIDTKHLLHNYNLFHYENTCLAGTFDRCHLGHLFLIQSSLLLSNSHYFIGVCSDDMIKHKGPFSLVQPNFIRKKNIRKIIELNGYKKNCEYVVQSIYDNIDVAGVDKNLNCLIVTTETQKGGTLCNEARIKNGLNEVDICVINCININLNNVNKISSSILRKEVLEIINIDKINKLYDIFKDMCSNNLDIKDINNINFWWHQILDFYSKKWRTYHNLNHIYDFIQLHEKYNNLISKNKNEFLISIFFHDIIYIPSRIDNEKKSKDLFNKFYEEIKPNNLNKEKVCEYIIETENHLLNKNYDDEELNLFMDMDMFIIAKDNWEEYENQIRKEYCFMNDTEYKNKRINFLENLNKKEKIFRNKIFYETYEKKAKENINNIINKINI